MSERAGMVYLAHIRDQLTEQRDRKKSLEQRGQTSVAISSGLVTLMLAFSNVGVLDPQRSVTTAVGVTLAILLLVAGAICGVIVTRPADYDETSEEGMRAWLEGELGRPPTLTD